MRIVLDTNVLVSGLLHSQGNPGRVLALALAGAVQVCHDPRILAEYAEVLARPRFQFNPERVGEVLAKLERDGTSIPASDRPLGLPDAGDEPFLAVALARLAFTGGHLTGRYRQAKAACEEATGCSGPCKNGARPYTGTMVAIEQIEQKLLALPLKHRVFLAEALLASVPPLDEEMTEAEEMAEVQRREREIETGQVRALVLLC